LTNDCRRNNLLRARHNLLGKLAGNGGFLPLDGAPGKEIGYKNSFKTGTMKIYIAGKISGLPKAEYTAKFLQAELALSAAGWEPVNPCSFGIPEDTPSAIALLTCIPELEKCQAIYMLNDWRDSLGARIELSTAMHERMDIYFEEDHTMEVMKKLKEEVA